MERAATSTAGGKMAERVVSARPSRGMVARRVFVWSAVVAYAVFFSATTVARHETFNSGTFDLAFMDQALWNTLRGNPLGVTIEPHIGQSELAYHFEPILFLIAPLYWLWPNPNLLLVLQSVALALGALPASWLAYERLRSHLAAAAFAVVYLLFPGLQAANVFDFHPFTLTAPLLLFAFYFLERGQHRRFAVVAVLALATKENVPLTVAMLGLYQAVIKREWRAGLATIGGAAVWFLVASYIIIPAYNQEGQGWLWNRYGGMGGSPLQIVWFLLTHPERLIQPAPGLDNLLYLGQLLFPVAFLSLLHPATFVLAAPGLATNLLTTYEAMHLLETYHYTASLVPIVVISATYGSGALAGLAGRLYPGAPRYVVWALVATVLATSLAYHYYRGYTPISPSFAWQLPNAHHAAGHRLAASIPPEASVSAQFNLGPHVSGRRQFSLYPDVRDADYIFLDAASHPNTGGLWDGYHDAMRAALERSDYGLVAAEDGFLLLRKGAPKQALPPAFYTFARTDAIPSNRLNLRFGQDLELIGFDVQVTREARADLTLYWRALRPVAEDLLLALFLTDGNGKELGATKHAQPANYWYPTSRWQPGETVKVQTMLLPWTPGERDFGLGVAVVRGHDPWAVGGRLPISVRDAGWLVGASGGGTIAEIVTFRNDRGLLSPEWRPRPRLAMGSATPVGRIGGKVGLASAPVEPLPARAGDKVTVRLSWQVGEGLETGYTAFVHLLAPGPRLVAQKDSPPLAGRFPTTFWLPGDVLADTYEIALPPDLAPGEYEVAVGLYDPATGKRLATVDAAGKPGDHLILPTKVVVTL